MDTQDDSRTHDAQLRARTEARGRPHALEQLPVRVFEPECGGERARDLLGEGAARARIRPALGELLRGERAHLAHSIGPRSFVRAEPVQRDTCRNQRRERGDGQPMEELMLQTPTVLWPEPARIQAARLPALEKALAAIQNAQLSSRENM